MALEGAAGSLGTWDAQGVSSCVASLRSLRLLLGTPAEPDTTIGSDGFPTVTSLASDERSQLAQLPESSQQGYDFAHTANAEETVCRSQHWRRRQFRSRGSSKSSSRGGSRGSCRRIRCSGEWPRRPVTSDSSICLAKPKEDTNGARKRPGTVPVQQGRDYRWQEELGIFQFAADATALGVVQDGKEQGDEAAPTAVSEAAYPRKCSGMRLSCKANATPTRLCGRCPVVDPKQRFDAKDLFPKDHVLLTLSHPAKIINAREWGNAHREQLLRMDTRKLAELQLRPPQIQDVRLPAVAQTVFSRRPHHQFKTLSAGDMFNMEVQIRQARVKNPQIIEALKSEDIKSHYREMREGLKFATIRILVGKEADDRTEEDRDYLLKYIRAQPFFKDLPLVVLGNICENFWLKRYNPQEALYTKGQEVEGIYIVLQGSASVRDVDDSFGQPRQESIMRPRPICHRDASDVPQSIVYAVGDLLRTTSWPLQARSHPVHSMTLVAQTELEVLFVPARTLLPLLDQEALRERISMLRDFFPPTKGRPEKELFAQSRVERDGRRITLHRLFDVSDVPRHQVLFQQGEKSQGDEARITLILMGSVRLLARGRVVDTVSTGTMLGDEAVHNEPYQTTAIVISPSARLMTLKVTDYITQFPSFAKRSDQQRADDSKPAQNSMGLANDRAERPEGKQNRKPKYLTVAASKPPPVVLNNDSQKSLTLMKQRSSPKSLPQRVAPMDAKQRNRNRYTEFCDDSSTNFWEKMRMKKDFTVRVMLEDGSQASDESKGTMLTCRRTLQPDAGLPELRSHVPRHTVAVGNGFAPPQDSEQTGRWGSHTNCGAGGGWKWVANVTHHDIDPSSSRLSVMGSSGSLEMLPTRRNSPEPSPDSQTGFHRWSRRTVTSNISGGGWHASNASSWQNSRISQISRGSHIDHTPEQVPPQILDQIITARQTLRGSAQDASARPRGSDGLAALESMLNRQSRRLPPITVQ